jgi:hypothetical protein
MKKLIKVSLFTVLLFTTSVKAQLMQWDAFTLGDALAVKDSESGLVWLDLSLTSGMNFHQAAGDMPRQVMCGVLSTPLLAIFS